MLKHNLRQARPFSFGEELVASGTFRFLAQAPLPQLQSPGRLVH